MDNVLIVSIYDMGYGFDAAIIKDNKEVKLDEYYVASLKKVYWSEELVNRAKELNFSGIIICEDGNIQIEFFD